MLCLTRRIGESVMIGDDIEVMVLASRNGLDKVRLGIKAPDDIRIHRREIYEQIHGKGETNESTS